MMRLTTLFCLLSISTNTVFAQMSKNQLATSHKSAESAVYFKLKLTKGQLLANVFARTIAINGEGFAPVIKRVSGTANYEVIDTSTDAPSFMETDCYDGIKNSSSEVKIGLNGNNEFRGKETVNTGAGGLLYNKFIWGKIPGKLKEGDSWEVVIQSPWELGGPGRQKVTVLFLDKNHETVTLKREGYGSGFFDQDTKNVNILIANQPAVKADVIPGSCHWIGTTTFRNGVTISDELMVTRPVRLTVKGKLFDASEREYILLNRMLVN